MKQQIKKSQTPGTKYEENEQQRVIFYRFICTDNRELFGSLPSPNDVDEL